MKTLITTICLAIAMTSIAQTTWTEISVPTTKHLNAIDFPNANVGYIGGEDSLLMKTTDGGLTWEEVEFTGITFFNGGEDFLELQFLTSDIGFATVGPYTGTYKTVDGGLTWTQLDTDGTLCYNHGLFFLDQTYGFVGGAGCFEGEKIEKFSMGTSSFATLNDPSLANDIIVDIDFDPTQFNSFGLAASSGGRIYRTVDSGDTWDSIPTGLGNGVPLTSITIVNDTLAYAGYDDGSGINGILYSGDAGLTWQTDFNSATFHYPIYNDVHSTVSQVVYCGAKSTSTTEGLILESTGAGVWNYSDVDQPIRNITSYNDTVVFAVGENGYVATNRDISDLSTDFEVEDLSIELFPNPTAESLTIELPSEITNESYSVNIFNSLGVVVKTFSNQHENISVKDLSSGHYTIQVRSNQAVWSSILIKQ